MKTLRTQSVDVAAYLHLNGVEPDEVVYADAGMRLREFRYKLTEYHETLLRAFEHGAMVPAKAFAEARAEMKKRNPRKAIDNFRRAVDRAVDQATGGRSNLSKES